MSSKVKKAGALAGLAAAAALVVAVVFTGLGLELPRDAGAPVTEGVILAQGFDPDENQWYFVVADCGGSLTTETMGDPRVPANFLVQCHDATRIDVAPDVWAQYTLGDDYPSK